MFSSVFFMQEVGVWRSLGDVLIGLVLCGITSSPVVESLWLCRKQQLPISEVNPGLIPVPPLE